ncbi:MAG: trypsin-like peptidase domain-containing protein [Acidobacteria bacterium]|nr:trypsin-like peptidase domain-containing protein [Acidobacteriota bacterium]
MPRRSVWVRLLLTGVLGLATGWWIWQRPLAREHGAALPEERSAAVASAADVAPSPDERNTIEVYRAVSPAVVNITSTTIQYDFFFNVFPTQGSGSGFLIDDKGDILTNYHVVSGARAIEVTLPDQTRHKATLVGRDRTQDLAVIKISDRKNLPFLKLGSSDALQVGQKVLAIGNPFGQFQGTLTTGVISSLARNIRDQEGRVLEDLIQTDATINPGNSGGPLLNSRGEVIGINTAIFGPGGTSVGIGFAIPVNTAKTILADLLQEGRVKRAYLGVSTQQITPPIAELLDLPASQGLLIARLERGGPADAAGIQGGRSLAIIGNQEFILGGDLLVEVDGTALNTAQDLTRYLQKKKPGDTVRLTLYRGRRRMTVDVKLGEMPDTD